MVVQHGDRTLSPGPLSILRAQIVNRPSGLYPIKRHDDGFDIDQDTGRAARCSDLVHATTSHPPPRREDEAIESSLVDAVVGGISLGHVSKIVMTLQHAFVVEVEFLHCAVVIDRLIEGRSEDTPFLAVLLPRSDLLACHATGSREDRNSVHTFSSLD